MSINIGPAASDDLRPKITVIGVGGAGGNAIANMIASEIEGVEFVVANTDAQALSSSPAEKRIQLGTEITKGLGAGAKPEVGKAAAEETVAEIEAALEGVNMVFIAAGMGGGTGTGAAPVIAETARRMGVLTVGVVTKPFLFEGTRRMRAADAGIADLQAHVDTLIVIPNQNLFLIASQDTTFKQAFEMADEVLQQGVRSITDLMVMPGLINLDFADVRSVMSEMGKAMMGTGEADGENRAKEAAEQAIANPLLDGVSMQGAKGVIISIIGGEDMKLFEVDGAANHIRSLVDEDANIIWGSAFNPDLDGKIRVSVVATGIEQGDEVASPAPMPAASISATATAMPAPRAPQRPVLDLMSEANAEEEPTTSVEEEVAEPEVEAPTFAPITLTPPETPSNEDEGVVEDTPAFEAEDEMELGADVELASDDEPETAATALFNDPVADAQEDEEDAIFEEAKPFDLTGMQAGDDMGELEDDDVDEIVDPLAGLRDADEEPFDLTGSEAPEETTEEPASTGFAGFGSSSDTGSVSSDTASEDASPSPASAAPSTLFERMANLSRSSGSDAQDEEDENEDDAPALSIPRFLGRQNNQ
ncbi:MAG: cell division protein FtsZ [Pseudomonadota bacterium]